MAVEKMLVRMIGAQWLRGTRRATLSRVPTRSTSLSPVGPERSRPWSRTDLDALEASQAIHDEIVCRRAGRLRTALAQLAFLYRRSGKGGFPPMPMSAMRARLEARATIFTRHDPLIRSSRAGSPLICREFLRFSAQIACERSDVDSSSGDRRVSRGPSRKRHGRGRLHAVRRAILRTD